MRPHRRGHGSAGLRNSGSSSRDEDRIIVNVVGEPPAPECGRRSQSLLGITCQEPSQHLESVLGKNLLREQVAEPVAVPHPPLPRPPLLHLVGQLRAGLQRLPRPLAEDVWRVGVRVRPDAKGVVRSEEVERRVREVMEGEMREEFRMRALEWSEKAKKSMSEGGTSDINISDFLSSFGRNTTDATQAN